MYRVGDRVVCKTAIIANGIKLFDYNQILTVSYIKNFYGRPNRIDIKFKEVVGYVFIYQKHMDINNFPNYYIEVNESHFITLQECRKKKLERLSWTQRRLYEEG